jgi:hypothetical protein
MFANMVYHRRLLCCPVGWRVVSTLADSALVCPEADRRGIGKKQKRTRKSAMERRSLRFMQE